jgi:hypothetical protein
MLQVGGQEHFYLEPNNCCVIPTENDEFTLFSSTQVGCQLRSCRAGGCRPLQLQYIGCICTGQGAWWLREDTSHPETVASALEA